jgi:hypothetical protein
MAELEDAARGLCSDRSVAAENAVSHEGEAAALESLASAREMDLSAGLEHTALGAPRANEAAIGPTADDPSGPRGLAPPTEMSGMCQSRLRALMGIEGLSGAPGLESNRARVLAYAKAEPVMFVRTPRPDANASPAARSYRAMIDRTSSPWSLIQKLTSVLAMNTQLGRQVLLREGYLYAEKPDLAFALVDLVKAHHLFDTPRIWIQRGETVLTAERSASGPYAYRDGPQRGQRVRLLLFDRIGTGEVPAPLHRDLRSLRQRLGFERAKVRHITEDEIVLELQYGEVSIPTVVSSRGPRLELGCELLPPDQMPQVSAARSRHARSQRVLAPLRRAMLAGVEEGLPFDEPLTEYGQQDGQLRRFWLRAYLDGKNTYEINGDRYSTFDPRGRPLVPQVCVDFVFDTLERASGTWWRARGDTPGRTAGKLDFGTITNEELRRASSFLALAEERSDWFETWTVPESERIPLKATKSLVEYLEAHAADFVPGDVVFIRGYAPWDKPWRPRVMHFHSFFVYETDPITGFPAMLVGNPGRPLLQTWQFEAFRTPDRSIWYRMRPRLEWLEEAISFNPDDAETLENAPLAAGPN